MNVFWFRRDLRLYDNKALYNCLASSEKTLGIFIFDSTILKPLNKKDARVEFIHLSLLKINDELMKKGSSLHIFNHKTPKEAFLELLKTYPAINAVYANEDYEPYAKQRDKEIANILKDHNIQFHLHKDQIIKHKNEILKDDGKAYTVYTPYSKKWYSALNPEEDFKHYPSEELIHQFILIQLPFPSLKDLQFQPAGIPFPEAQIEKEIIKEYEKNRDYPALNGTTKVSLFLRFGTISLRQLSRLAFEHSKKYLNELVWREFYQYILYHFPSNIHQAFRKEYEQINWRNNEKEFQLWCEGKTGYPMVDAGMRQLNKTGYMHNRVRMVVSSFLCKHLLIDWRWGEAYFAEKLLDFDLASNNGGWQWSAGCGVDAAPYFRIFNPTTQLKKFDVELKYVRQFIPEVDSLDYPQPMVDHNFARNRCLETYKAALSKNK